MGDKTITCIQCGNEFVVTVSERERFLSRGFGMPKRCSECRKHKAKISQPEERGKRGRHRFEQEQL
ncbi:MAG: zinc-ribbon domain containing protein [Pseudomonadota bacterium]